MRKIAVLLLLCTPAFAADSKPSFKAASTTSAGQGDFSEALSLSGDHPLKQDEDPGSFIWNAGYTYSRTPVGTDSNKTNAIDAGVGYRRSLDAGLGFETSKTAQENLTDSGPSAYLGYIFGGAGEGFHRSLEPKLSWKNLQYRQTFTTGSTTRSGSRRSITRPTTGNENIRQNEYTLSLDIAALDWLSVHVAGSSYKYDKDVSRFLGLLDSQKSVNTKTAGFAQTLGGFPKSGGEIGLSIFPFDTWTFTIEGSSTKIQVDNSNSMGEKVGVEKDLTSALKVGLGFDHETSANQGQQNETSLDLSYSF